MFAYVEYTTNLHSDNGCQFVRSLGVTKTWLGKVIIVNGCPLAYKIMQLIKIKDAIGIGYVSDPFT